MKAMNCTSQTTSLSPDALAITIIPQLGISLVSWIQLILSLNLFRGIRHFRSSEFFALFLYIVAAFVRVIAGAATVTQNLALQLAAASVATGLVFAAFVIIYNQGFIPPSRQQWISAIFVVVPTFLWEAHTRIFMDMT